MTGRNKVPFQADFSSPGSFGSQRVNPGQGQSLTLSVHAFEATDSSLLEDQATTLSDNRFRGFYSSVRGGIDYKRQHRSRAFSLSAGTSLRYYPEVDLSALSHTLSASFSAGLGRHTRLQIQQSIQRSPFYMVAILNDGLAEESTPASVSSSEYSTFRWKSMSLATGFSLTREVGRRSSVTINYGQQMTGMNAATFRAHSAGATYNYRVARYAVARVGYSKRWADHRGAVASLEQDGGRSHALDLGLDYSRPFTLWSSRRTKVAFSKRTLLRRPLHDENRVGVA